MTQGFVSMLLSLQWDKQEQSYEAINKRYVGIIILLLEPLVVILNLDWLLYWLNTLKKHKQNGCSFKLVG